MSSSLQLLGIPTRAPPWFPTSSVEDEEEPCVVSKVYPSPPGNGVRAGGYALGVSFVVGIGLRSRNGRSGTLLSVVTY